MRTPRIVAGATAAVLALGLLAAAPAAAATSTVATLDHAASATGRTGDLRLAWNAVPGATQYKVEIAETEGFGTSVVDSVTTTATRWVPTTPLWGSNGDRELFWRVVPVGVTTSANDAAVGSFTRAQAPTTSLAAPTADATVSYPSPVTFSWAPVAGASSYLLSYGVSGSAAPTTVTVTDTTWTPDLLAAGRYEWSVTPRFPLPGLKTEYSGTASAVRAFTVTWPGSSATPSLVSPADRAALNDPLFEWTAVDGARSYTFQLSSDVNFSSTAIVVDAEVTGTVFAPVHVLLNNTYYWRVAAKNPDGSLAWSAAQQFSKRMSSHTESVVNGGFPDTGTTEPRFTNISTDPDNPTALDFDRFRLEWQAVPRATHYEVLVRRQNDASTDTLSCLTGSNSATIVATSTIHDSRKITGSTSCLWNTKEFSAIRPGDDLYLATVRAINMSAAATGPYSTDPVLTASTSQESANFYFTVRQDDRTTPTGETAQVIPISSPTQAVSPRIEWRPVPGATGYFVKIYSDASMSTLVGEVRTTTATVQLTGVFELNNTTSSADAYTIVVDAASGDWKQPARWSPVANTSGSGSFLRNAPTPAAGTVTNYNGAQLLQFTPTPPTALGGASRGYQVDIYQKDAGQVYKTLKVDQPMVVAAAAYSAPGATTKMTALPTGDYEFTWAVLDPVGKAAQPSPRVAFTIGGTTATDLSSSITSSGTSATLAWKNATAAEKYTVSIRATTDARTTTYTSKARAITATGLLPGATYEWSVTSTDKDGNVSRASSTATFTVPQHTVSVASATISGVSASTATISWEAVSGASRYLVRVATSTAGLASARAVETTALSYTPTTALVYGTAYVYDVRAVPAALTTAASRPVLARTAQDGSLTVVTAPGTPTSLKLTATATTLTATWADLVGVTRGSAVAPGYLLRYGVERADGLEPTWTSIVVGANLSRTITRLKAGTSYLVQVSAANTQGQSAWSRSSKVKTSDSVPSAPRLSSVKRGSGSVTVKWAAPTSAGSSGITGYQVQTRTYAKGKWSAWTSLKVASSARSAKVTRLSNGVKTEARVIATSRAGNSPASTSKVVTPAGKPLAAKVTVKSTKKKTVKVTWKAASANGSKVTGYRVQYSTNGKKWKTLKTTKASARSYTWKKGKSKKTVYFRVQAKNALGWGTASKGLKVTVK